MELDDFRQSWKQPTVAEASFDVMQLQILLKARPGLVEKMQRNVRIEAALTALLMMIVLFLTLQSDKPLSMLQGFYLILIGAGQLYYYYYKLGVLRRMATVEGNVRSHLQKLCTELRSLLHFFYQVTMWTGPITLALGFCYFTGRELARPDGVRVLLLIITAGALLLGGALLQATVRMATRRYLQRLYGQHLDRLENLLRELEE